jgi:isoquinoline 1-oxidoreductase beta subunit
MSSSSSKITRRAALVAGATIGSAALVVGFRHVGAGRASRQSTPHETFKPNAFLRITDDGRVTAVIACCEMGQAIHTALAMVLADELDADWKDMAVEDAPVAAEFANPFFNGVQATMASTSVAVYYDTTRQAAAAARMMLVEAARTRWGVAAADCRTSNGRVLGPGQRSLSYGELVATAAGMRPPAKEALKLKDPKDFKLIGRSIPRIEGLSKVTGQPVYGLDVDLPGMLTAMVARAPVKGAKVKGYQRSAAEKYPGVRAVVEVPSGIAVIADHYWAALRARKLLNVEWDLGPNGSVSSPDLERSFSALSRQSGPVAVTRGDVTGELARSKKTVVAEYSVPYLAHAPMEPLNCTIRASATGCDVWVGTQYPSLDMKVLTRIFGIPASAVHLHRMFLGGGFGRRGSPDEDVVAETAEIVKATTSLNAPIRNVWAREDDIGGGFYRPMAVNRLEATLGGDGFPKAWLHRIVSQSPVRSSEFEFLVTKGIDQTCVAGAQDIPYAIPNLQVELQTPETGPTVQWMRSVGNSNTCFAIECFLDELARQTQKDPVEYRRKLLSNVKENERLLNVLNLAAEKADWGRALPVGTAQGVAIQDYWGTKVAQIAQVTVRGNGLRVERVVCAIDCGRVVNPDGVRMQIEGGIIFGLSAALGCEITLQRGQSEQSNFDSYPVMRMSAAPQIEVHIVSSAEAPAGAGEVAVPHIAPAVCNAIFRASGRRIRQLPLTRSGLEV